MSLRSYAGGWQPAPFREFVLKIHSRCNLACDYCYMYEMADQSWHSRPKQMSAAIAEQTASRIGEHVRRHAVSDIGLVLHGGEPLLAGPDLIAHLVAAVRDAVGDRVTTHTSVQTNGIGLDDGYLALFDQLGIHIGVSLDGTATAQDRHRRFAGGRGSHAAVNAGLQRLTKNGTGTCSMGCCVSLTCKMTRSRRMRPCWHSSRPGSTSCFRTEHGRHRPLAALPMRPAPPMPIG